MKQRTYTFVFAVCWAVIIPSTIMAIYFLDIYLAFVSAVSFTVGGIFAILRSDDSDLK